MPRFISNLIGLSAIALAGSAAIAVAAPPGGRITELKTIFIEANSQKEPVLGAVANLYPPSPRKAGVEGDVVLRCGVAPEDRFSDCEIVDERPADQGFGASALQASQLVRQPIPAARKGERAIALIPFRYRLEEGREKLLKEDNYEWEARPTAAQLSRVYPPAAMRGNRDGWAIIGCRVTAEGRMADCHAYDEWPSGQRFTEAALAVAGMFKLKSVGKDGRPIPEGAHVRLPVFFKMPK